MPPSRLPSPPFVALQVTPRTVPLSEPEFHGAKLNVWSVRVNGHELTNIAQPFRADHETVELLACTACGSPGCGHDFLAARRLGEFVAWFPFDPVNRVPERHLPEDCVIWFQRDQYQPACGVGSVDDLPPIDSSELATLLSAQLRPWPEAIYVDGVDPLPHPLAPFLRELTAALCDPRAEIVDAPDLEPTHEVVLGLDLQGCPEARLWLSSLGGRWHAAVVERPCFPIWFRTRALDKLLTGVALTRRIGPEAS